MFLLSLLACVDYRLHEAPLVETPFLEGVGVDSGAPLVGSWETNLDPVEVGEVRFWPGPGMPMQVLDAADLDIEPTARGLQISVPADVCGALWAQVGDYDGASVRPVWTLRFMGADLAAEAVGTWTDPAAICLE